MIGYLKKLFKMVFGISRREAEIQYLKLTTDELLQRIQTLERIQRNSVNNRRGTRK
ncbi:MAG TPA: hypothetical protein VFM18_20550 [Methanosarcina sp.]|nr:hypothetical protein [Methanosarcina sp.]